MGLASPRPPVHARLCYKDCDMWKSRRIPPAQPAWAALFAFSAGVLSAQATVEGTVVNSVTRAGIEGVSVKFYTQQGVRYETTTGGGGTFRIAGMRNGDYLSTLEKEAFERPKSSDFPYAGAGYSGFQRPDVSSQCAQLFREMRPRRCW